jgi:hypothetical protein
MTTNNWMKEFDFVSKRPESEFPLFFNKTILTEKERKAKKCIKAYNELKKLINLNKEVWDT